METLESVESGDYNCTVNISGSEVTVAVSTKARVLIGRIKFFTIMVLQDVIYGGRERHCRRGRFLTRPPHMRQAAARAAARPLGGPLKYEYGTRARAYTLRPHK